MKKIILTICMMLILPVFADVMPFYVNSIPKDTIGMYQTGESITILSEPEANSITIKNINFSYKPE